MISPPLQKISTFAGFIPHGEMSVSKKILRGLVLPLALALKADKHFLGKTRKSCCILNFHGVRKHNKAVFNNRHMPVEEFEKVIMYLKKNFDIVSLSELFDIHRSKRKVARKTIALTFDDGYLNNFDIALPVLKKYQVPATFYIISRSLDTPQYLAWPDAIDVIKKNHKEDITIDGHTFNYPAFYCQELQRDLPAYLKTCGERTEGLAQDLLKRFGYAEKEIAASPELLLLIDREGLARFASEPLLDIGSHSHSHFNMEFLSPEVAKQELKQSKELIEQATGKSVISFAFPDGSYTPQTVQLAKELGYSDVVAVEYRYNEQNSDPGLLSRFTISNSTTCESNMLRFAKQFDKYGF